MLAPLKIVFKVLLKTAVVLGVAFQLLGCAAPVAVTVASLAADGATLAASGKSISDHALSAATGSDCSAMGWLDDGVLCRNRIPAAVVHVENEAPPLAAPPAPPARPASDNSEATFLALGSFPDWDNADRAVVYGRFYNPLIVPLDTDITGEKASALWVVAGRPLTSGDNAVPIAQAKSIGFDKARTIVLCRATYRPAPCVAEEADLAAAKGDASAIAVKIAAARRPNTSVAQRADAPATGSPEKLY
jgi:hypothetical protein